MINYLKTKNCLRIFLFAFLILQILLLSFNLNAQRGLMLKFEPCWKGSKLIEGQSYQLDDQSITVDQLKFYISNIQLYKKGKKVGSVEQKHFLIDCSNPESLTITAIPSIRFDSIHFNLGIDSLTNVSGVFGGDLDPLNGMYWTWQSGYINFKLEGKASNCPARNNRFNLHLGGYLAPHNSLCSVGLKVKNKSNIQINFDVRQLLQEIDLEEVYNIMSPGEEAVQLSRKVANIFTVYER